MNILEETFTAHEHLAPDADEVLRTVRRAAGRKHRVAPRTVAVAGVGATVAAVAVGSVVLSGTDAPRAAHHTVTTTHPAASQRPAPPTVTRIAGPDHNTFGAGWLPSDKVTVSLASNSLQWGQEIEYDMRVGKRDVTVLIQYGPTWDARSKTGPGAGTLGTFLGHPSQTWDAGGYWKLEYRRDASHVAIVEVIVDDAQGTGAGAYGRHVARDLRFDVDTPIDPGAYLTYLPAGVHLSSVSAQDFGFAWSVAKDGSRADQPLVQIAPIDGFGSTRTIKLNGPQPSGAPIGKPGRPVQGHRSYVDQHGSSILLTVPGLVPGRTLQFFSSPAVPTLDALYRVADGLRRS